MEKIDKQSVLDKTHFGLDIYAHILRVYYPGQTVLSLSGRTCAPARNPFNADKPTLMVVIVDNEARHTDTDNTIAEGNALDFAELHYKFSDKELLKKINSDMQLHIAEKKEFYLHNKTAKNSSQSPINPHVPLSQSQNSVFLSPNGESTQRGIEVGGLGEALFSFFKAPVRNTIPHKSICLLDAYNYIVGDYAKQRTEKLRSIKDQKQARQFKASTFDYCAFSGMFTIRNDKALVSHSGLLCIDFDHLQSVDLLRNQLLQDEYFDTQLLFRSPSGDGLKWIIQISTPLGEPAIGIRQLVGFSHSDFFAAVANYMLQTYSVAVDKSGRDISRACFLPHDPDAYINPLYKLSTL